MNSLVFGLSVLSLSLIVLVFILCYRVTHWKYKSEAWKAAALKAKRIDK
jgi:hypothetical protein